MHNETNFKITWHKINLNGLICYKNQPVFYIPLKRALPMHNGSIEVHNIKTVTDRY